jgi:uncharacterized RDD family membrane protein YckC
MQDLDPYRPPAASVESVETLAQARMRASRGARFVAELLNNVFFALTLAPALIGLDVDADIDGIGSILGLTISAVLMIALAVVQIVMLNQNSWSLGKRLLRIRIVRSDYSEASLGRLLGLRIAVPTVIGMGTTACIPIFGSLFTVVDACFIFGSQRRCLHDLIADTIVVRA